jgi:large subunit ribosomal protein L9
MKIILLEDVKTLGKKGDVKEVAEGYARNFLMPKKLAQMATQTAIKNAKTAKAKEKEEETKILEKLRGIAGNLKGKEITLKAKEKKGKLFGSITPKEIVQALKKEGFDILEKSIIIKGAIKKVGEHEVRIELDKEIDVAIRVNVQGE